MDLWRFKRGDEHVSVTARGWLVVDNAHRDTLRARAAGAGVARLLDWHKRKGMQIASGLLVLALTDWEHDDVPPVNCCTRRAHAASRVLRLSMYFVTQLSAKSSSSARCGAVGCDAALGQGPAAARIGHDRALTRAVALNDGISAKSSSRIRWRV